MTYSYSNGDLLNSPNSYFYSNFSGKQFLNDWSQSRSITLDYFRLEKKSKKNEKNQKFKTNHALKNLLKIALSLRSKKIPGLLEIFLKRFEITKRVYDEYDSSVRAIDRTQYINLDNYVFAAEVFETAYRKTNDFRFLNALLKVMDIICAHYEMVSSKLNLLTFNLLILERSHISKLGKKIGLEII